ncbi:MAG TPA: 3-isopropylmalate dehydratase large subunit [Firmicutes bacterium]|nr:3-isopropylmalate dehydratase large subunit [Bacillota bacterium]
MGKTLAEKILAIKSKRSDIKADDFVMAEVDLVLGNDITAPVAIKEFRRLAKNVFDKDKIVLVCDHFTPNKDIQAAEQVKFIREFAREYNLTHFYDVGDMGIEHCLIPEKGLALPGDLIIGADSHTCTYGALGAFSTGVGSTDMAAAMALGKAWFRVPHTIRFNFSGDSLKPFVTGKDLILYTIGQIGVDGARYKAMEFGGAIIDNLSIESRLTMANMAIEAGAKAGLFAADKKTVAYLQRAGKSAEEIYPDKNASYYKVYDFDASSIEPQVAFPHLPENARSVSEAKGIKIDQVVLGSCTNGRIEDLRQAAEILKGKKVHQDVRMIVIPGTQRIYLQAIEEGLMQVFIEAGAAVSTPTCGPCLGGHMGILASHEVALSTTNRNFVGRMGHPQSAVYLTGPYVAAASAIKGEITHPKEVL